MSNYIPAFFQDIAYLHWFYWLLLVVAGVIGLFVNILGLPGLWLMVASFIGYAWLTGFDVYVGWVAVIAMVSLGVLAEAVEFFAGSAGVAVAGGSKRGMIGAIGGGLVGGIAGTPVFPIVGTIIGAIAGSFGGAWLVEKVWVGRTPDDSTRIGLGAAKGRFLGIVTKTAIGIVMLMVAMWTAAPFGLSPTATLLSAPTTVPTTTSPTTAPTTSPTDTPTTLPVEIEASPAAVVDGPTTLPSLEQ